MSSKSLTSIIAVAASLLWTTAGQAADLAATIAATPELSTFSAALKAAGLDDTLKGKGPFTVFVPTDEAFKRLPANTMTNLMKPENKEQLTKLLTIHVLPAKVVTKDMEGKMYKTKTLNGKEVEIDADDPGEGIRVSKAKITRADIPADNGIVHIVNRVVLP
jgi:uncharacterized surface protein with fasciclin (FAS1) repeats